MFDQICHLPNYGRHNYHNYVSSRPVAGMSELCCTESEGKCMPWNAKRMTFGGVSHLHFEKTRELTGIESPSSVMSLPWASPFCLQDHQTAAVSLWGCVLCSCLEGECSPPASLNCECGKLAFATWRVSALHTYLCISAAGGVWNTHLWSIRCLCNRLAANTMLGIGQSRVRSLRNFSGLESVVCIWFLKRKQMCLFLFSMFHISEDIITHHLNQQFYFTNFFFKGILIFWSFLNEHF